MRTLRPAGKLEQLTHAMSRYHWNIVGLCEMAWKNFGEISKMMDTRFISVEKRTVMSMGLDYITIIQLYAPTSGHDDSEVDHFYQQL